MKSKSTFFDRTHRNKDKRTQLDQTCQTQTGVTTQHYQANIMCREWKQAYSK